MDAETRNYLEYIVDPAVRQYCGPLFFTTSLTTPANNILQNGSFGLVNTGRKNLLVTCNHVWEEFKELLKGKSNLMFSLCIDKFNPVVIPDPDSLFVDADKRCDLATFDTAQISEAFVSESLQFFNISANPPPKLHEGDTLYMIGFPGKGRRADERSLGFSRQPIGVVATEVGNFGFFANAKNLNLDTNDFGGISGCPCFLVLKDKPIRLVGFATGYAPGNFATLQFTYARFIQPDGIIQYMS